MPDGEEVLSLASVVFSRRFFYNVHTHMLTSQYYLEIHHHHHHHQKLRHNNSLDFIK